MEIGVNIFQMRAHLKYIHQDVFDFVLAKYLDIDCELCCAASNGYLETVKYLISLGANNDIALYWAIRHGHLETTEYLISVGINLCEYHEDAVCWADMYGYSDTVKYIDSINVMEPLLPRSTHCYTSYRRCFCC